MSEIGDRLQPLTKEQEKAQEDFLYANSIEELIGRWDEGRTIFTIEMGGLGPSYEQCIHICCFELLRERDKWLESKDDELENNMNQTIWGNAECKKLGLSGAQAGAAKQIAYRFATYGYRESLKTIPEDRKIQVSKKFPN